MTTGIENSFESIPVCHTRSMRVGMQVEVANRKKLGKIVCLGKVNLQLFHDNPFRKKTLSKTFFF
jgi:hypothetical protein